MPWSSRMTWILIGVAAVIVIGCSAKSAGSAAKGGSPASAAALAESSDPKQWVADGALLLDVRSPGEFAGGHLKGAVNIPIQALGSRLDEVSADKVVVYCASGIRSRSARKLLEKQGKAVLDIKSMRGWGAGAEIVR